MGSNQNTLKFDAVAENFAYFQTKPSMLILKGYISIYLKKLHPPSPPANCSFLQIVIWQEKKMKISF